ncbi:MAG: hypothetical protein ACLTDR_09390 [Adlercreutzia equolifaciens]
MTELDPRNSASPADSAPDEGLSPRAAAEAKKAAAASRRCGVHPEVPGTITATSRPLSPAM